MQPEHEPSLLQLSDWGILDISGADATTFLHGQFTNDLQALTDDYAQWSAYCLPKGQTIASFLIWRDAENKYRLVLPKEAGARVLKRLQMFRLRADVELSDVTDSWALLGQHTDSADPKIYSGTLPKAPLEIARTGTTSVIRWPGNRPRYLILLEATDNTAGIQDDTLALWRRWDIEEGLPFIRNESCERFVPQHINLDLMGAVSLSKGCYPGQEVIARMHYRGKVKHRTYRLGCDRQSLTLDSEIWPAHASRACGQVVEVWTDPEQETCQVLASLRVADADAPLHAETADGAPLTQLPLPYSNHDHKE